MLWEIEICPAEGQPDRAGQAVAHDAAGLGLGTDLEVRAARGYLIQGELTYEQAQQLARSLLADEVVERARVAPIDSHSRGSGSDSGAQLVHVLPRPGVTDPVAESLMRLVSESELPIDAVCTMRKYWLPQLEPDSLRVLTDKVLANDSIDQVVYGPLAMERLQLGSTYKLHVQHIPIGSFDDAQLQELSRERQLSMTLPELHAVQHHFQSVGRDPTDVELETIAQTWSEHCSHKTLAGRIAYRDERGELHFDNMLKETIFATTAELRESLGEQDWCVSVFKDNAGVIRFDDRYNLVFKVETHNRPSAIEPYGGANTGIGGVIRDTLGTGLGARPFANTDVFCFAPPSTAYDRLPPGILHPRRIMHGVVSGVRDYGNRMGIPTVNGAIYFDERYLGNPLVFCGNVGIVPRDKSFKQPRAGDLIVSVGGRTGRDGIHGATFSSAELTAESEQISGGAVQIGNAITEKMVADVLLQARDEGLFHAITDCGAGGFSSAVGEMGEEIGAEVWLDRAPLKYQGLSYTEIWISEAQERMVCAVPENHWDRFADLCAAENVEASVIGRFVPTGRLVLKYGETQVADLSMEFLHGGRPPVIRDAHYQSPPRISFQWPDTLPTQAGPMLLQLLAAPNIASKEWVIRQYDHEVQGGSVIKPLVGAENDGPSDAAVVRPRLDSQRAAVIACGMNPYLGDLDPRAMAASAIDEAIRNCVAVGADPDRIAILDNFCWGYTDRPETLGRLVRAALGCKETAIAMRTPFISGKDSLNNEFSYVDDQGARRTISIPSTLLISALGQVADARRCVTMDVKEPGNRIYLVGETRGELGGSHLSVMLGVKGGDPPSHHPRMARSVNAAIHQCIQSSVIRACHDLSEGGLAVAAAEMAFAGGWGLDLSLPSMELIDVESTPERDDWTRLFCESNSRYLCEVPPEREDLFRRLCGDVPAVQLGTVTRERALKIVGSTADGPPLIEVPLAELKRTWQSTLNWG